MRRKQDNRRYHPCPMCGQTCKHESFDNESNQERIVKVGKRDSDPKGLTHVYRCSNCEANPGPYKVDLWSSIEVPYSFLKALVKFRDEVELRILQFDKTADDYWA